jgi:phage terminase large subunit-like protein
MSVLTVPDDKGIWYPSLGGQVCDFIEECLVFGPGDLRGLTARLDKDKRALIWRMYEVYPQGHAAAGRRRFKRVGISLPKGCAKTELAAWIAACELHPEAPVRCIGWDKRGNPIGGPVTDPYIPMVAYTEEQSDELCYGALKVILEEGPLRDDFDIGLERIMRKRGDGKVVSLSSSPNARDGARTTFSVMDETHWWTLPRLIRAHQTMMANLPKRKEADAWGLEVTTAPEPGAGSVAEKTMEYAQAVKEGRIKDARLFYYHRQASEEHKLDTVEDVRAAVIEASGEAARWRDIDAIVELWRDPTTDPAFFERVYCNRLVKAALKAFDAEEWKTLKRPESPLKDGDLITLGFDGGMFHDGTALIGCHIETGYLFVLGAWECPFGKKDWKVPEKEVDETVEEAFRRYNIWRMYADPPYWQSWLSTWAGRYGAERVIEWWTNRRKPMSHALETFETGIKTREISHDGSGLLGRHIANSFRSDLKMRDEETGKPLWLIHKERSDSPNKIDAAMAAVLAWQGRMDAVKLGVNTKSVYEERGPLIYSL